MTWSKGMKSLVNRPAGVDPVRLPGLSPWDNPLGDMVQYRSR